MDEIGNRCPKVREHLPTETKPRRFSTEHEPTRSNDGNYILAVDPQHTYAGIAIAICRHCGCLFVPKVKHFASEEDRSDAELQDEAPRSLCDPEASIGHDPTEVVSDWREVTCPDCLRVRAGRGGLL